MARTGKADGRPIGFSTSEERTGRCRPRAARVDRTQPELVVKSRIRLDGCALRRQESCHDLFRARHARFPRRGYQVCAFGATGARTAILHAVAGARATGGGRMRLWLGVAVVTAGAQVAAEEARGPASFAEPSPPKYEIAFREAVIPMPDGGNLAADVYLPSGGPRGERFPVLLEYLPSRKNEARGRDYPLYSYFVRRGYAVARVDIRGTGNSEGKLIAYEYTDQEQTDGEAVIDWLSKQPFSTGKVGMFGISWGGFNSIHMSMRNPPALKAIIAICATDDLYQDDVHFIDGMMHVDSWEMSQDLANLLPAPPDYKIDDKYFEDRFDTRPWMLTYKRQQRDGPFWKRTALKERYDVVRVPTF